VPRRIGGHTLFVFARIQFLLFKGRADHQTRYVRVYTVRPEERGREAAAHHADQFLLPPLLSFCFFVSLPNAWIQPDIVRIIFYRSCDLQCFDVILLSAAPFSNVCGTKRSSLARPRPKAKSRVRSLDTAAAALFRNGFLCTSAP
jgi:hypothetical protein